MPSQSSTNQPELRLDLRAVGEESRGAACGRGVVGAGEEIEVVFRAGGFGGFGGGNGEAGREVCVFGDVEDDVADGDGVCEGKVRI